MARPLRIEYAGAVYHVTVRGNQRSNIFRSTQDRERFLFKLEESAQRYDIRVYLFCLMTTHIHLVLETPRGNLGKFMHRLQTAYTVYFNRRHQQCGHLMQGRYGASVVDEDEYILKLSRYVHLNPVYIAAHRKKIYKERVDVLRGYVWSSYRSYIGKAKPLSFVDYAPILAMMGRVKRKQPGTYRRFVESGIQDIDAAFIESKRQSRLCIGSGSFHAQVDEMYQELVDGCDSKEDVSFRHEAATYPMEAVLDGVCQVLEIDRSVLMSRQRDSLARPLAAKALCDYSGMTQREIAKLFNLSSGTAVSKQLARLSAVLKRDKSLRKVQEKINRAILNQG
jgi:putative transposase